MTDTFAAGADKRRAYRLRERMAANPDALSQSMIQPGLIQQDAASLGQMFASAMNFDRAGFAFDVTNRGPFTCFGQTGSGSQRWVKPGGASNGLDVRAYVGPTDRPLYIWVFATIGFSTDATGTGDAVRFVPALYIEQSNSSVPAYVASNITSTFVPADGKFYQIAYVGFIGIDPIDAAFLGTGHDWNLGMLLQYSAGNQTTKATINRQSIVTFLSDGPDDGVVFSVQASTINADFP